VFLQTTAGHNSGPPQQTYYLGSILLMKKNWKHNKKLKIKQTWKNTPKKLYTIVAPPINSKGPELLRKTWHNSGSSH
jgi:hypothetical protein